MKVTLNNEKTKASNLDETDKKVVEAGTSKMPPTFDLQASTLHKVLKVKPTPPKEDRVRKRKYKIGMHGYKKLEQKRLKAMFDQIVNGDSHESEHPIGFEPINHSNEGKRGDGDRARLLENGAPAYQEEKKLHRKHIGTGNHQEEDASGFNSKGYRYAQRQLLLQNNPGDAVQLNQLAYSFNPDFKFEVDTPQMQANESFFQMVKQANTFLIANDQEDENGKIVEKNEVVNFQEGDTKEMLASRAVALLKRYLNTMELSILQEVENGNIDFNHFLFACKKGDFGKILDALGLSDEKEHFAEQYKKYRDGGHIEMNTYSQQKLENIESSEENKPSDRFVFDEDIDFTIEDEEMSERSEVGGDIESSTENDEVSTLSDDVEILDRNEDLE